MSRLTANNSGESPPTPSYEDATSASNPLLGEPSNLTGSSLNYRPPAVHSPRRSEDSQYDPALDDDLTSLETTSDTEEGVDDLDYQGVELDDLGGSSSRRPRRRSGKSGWKERISDLTKRVGKWKLWKQPAWLCASMPSCSCPTLPDLAIFGPAVIARLIGLIILILLGYAFFAFTIFPASQSQLAAMFDLESVRQFAQGNVDTEKIRGYLEHVTKFDHMAGTEGSFYLAEWMKGLFHEAGLDQVNIDEYQVYLNYPTKGGRRVAITDPPEKRWEARVDELIPTSNPDSANKTYADSFHGLSRSGTASGPLLYFNYGSHEDFDFVCSQTGVKCEGAIALIRNYGPLLETSAQKIKHAEKMGIKGALIFTHSNDDGSLAGPTFPQGRYRPADSTMRESVALSDWIMGDVLTPGWASSPDAKRIGKDDNPALVNIPSLPLSWSDAESLLKSLEGHGSQAPTHWDSGNFWTGDRNSPTILIQNNQDEVEKQKIFNVMGKIDGAEKDGKVIIIGNHRDSWCIGASDPGSGTAVMLELVRILGMLRSQGWRPLRTIIIASWDAGAYNSIGSTEFVEEQIDELRKNGIAYLNVGAGVSGPDFHASASPLFQRALQRVLDRVADPNRQMSVQQLWESSRSKLRGIDSNGDVAPFQHIAGMTSIDLGFRDKKYPSHSCYETYEWMTTFGDPGLQYHNTLAQAWILLLLEVAQDYLLPFGLFDYVNTVKDQAVRLAKRAVELGSPQTVSFKPIDDALTELSKTARLREDWEIWWFGQVYGTGVLETNALADDRRKHNHRLTDFETNLLDIQGSDEAHVEGQPYGLKGREQFKNVIVGPSIGDASMHDSMWLPFVREAIEAKDWNKAQEMIDKTARILSRAAKLAQA